MVTPFERAVMDLGKLMDAIINSHIQHREYLMEMSRKIGDCLYLLNEELDERERRAQ